MNRQEIIKAILDVAENQRRALYRPAQRFELMGSDGKAYGLGMPHGVECVGRGKEYWVAESVHLGTTHGKRYASEAEYNEAQNESCLRHRQEFELALVDMSDEQLAIQADYWLK